MYDFAREEYEAEREDNYDDDRDRYEDADDNDAVTGICDSCGEECSSICVDQGIGPYEYWGAKGCHHDYQNVSPCCEDAVVPGGNKHISTTTHTSRRVHSADGDNTGNHHYMIYPGDRYKKTVTFCWREGGAGWYKVTKIVLARGSDWNHHRTENDIKRQEEREARMVKRMAELQAKQEAKNNEQVLQTVL